MASRDNDRVALAKAAYSYMDTESPNYGNVNTFFEFLADDVVFTVTCSPDTPVYGGAKRGKAAVIKFFTEDDPGVLTDLQVDGPLEFLGAGDRVVVLCSQSYTIKRTGRRIRNKACALVVDFHDELITRILNIEDLSDWNYESRRAKPA